MHIRKCMQMRKKLLLGPNLHSMLLLHSFIIIFVSLHVALAKLHEYKDTALTFCFFQTYTQNVKHGNRNVNFFFLCSI